jgi:hypothetical protein
MSNILHDSKRQTITLPTRHPSWCNIGSHQGVLDDLLDGNDEPLTAEEVDRVRQHWAMAGEHFTREDGSWIITLEQQPDIDDIAGRAGHPLISLSTTDLGLEGASCILNITSGEARVLAAQLTAAADKIDLT